VAYHHDKAKSTIVEGIGTHFDPEVAEAFLAHERQFSAIREQYAELETQRPAAALDSFTPAVESASSDLSSGAITSGR
jgi:hypothetical protein